RRPPVSTLFPYTTLFRSSLHTLIFKIKDTERMAKPIILAVDDEPAVLNAVARDLRQQYGENYRILRASSGSDALETVKELKQRNENLALFLVDQRMPGMSGVEFLRQAIQFYPGAAKVLLTAYADT